MYMDGLVVYYDVGIGGVVGDCVEYFVWMFVVWID